MLNLFFTETGRQYFYYWDRSDWLIRLGIRANGGEKGEDLFTMKKPQEISRLSNAGGGVEKITFSLFSLSLFQRDGDDSSRKKWKYQGSVEEENGHAHQRLSAGVRPHLSFSLSLIYSQTDVHTPLTDSYPPDKRPFLICVTIRADGPLFARGSLELLPFE